MHHRINPGRRFFCAMIGAMACIGLFPAQSAAQTWPDAPSVFGSFDNDHIALAATREQALDCATGANSVYCTDPAVSAYRQRLLEAWAAAYNRVPDSDDAPLIAPVPAANFNIRLQICGNETVAMMHCGRPLEDIRNEYRVLGKIADKRITGQACTETVQTACMLQLLSGRIAAWNHHNERWSRKFGPVTKVDRMTRETIRNGKEKNAYA